MRSRGLTTIVGLGIVTALFMAIMSMFYLQQIPTQADLQRLEDDVRREHGLYLSATAPLEATLVRPKVEGERTGVLIVCTMRQDLRRRTDTVGLYLERIADAVVRHPEWRGKVGFVTVRHAPPLDLERTVRADGEAVDPVEAAAPPEAPLKKAPPGKAPVEKTPPAKGKDPAPAKDAPSGPAKPPAKR